MEVFYSARDSVPYPPPQSRGEGKIRTVVAPTEALQNFPLQACASSFIARPLLNAVLGNRAAPSGDVRGATDQNVGGLRWALAQSLCWACCVRRARRPPTSPPGTTPA